MCSGVWQKQRNISINPGSMFKKCCNEIIMKTNKEQNYSHKGPVGIIRYCWRSKNLTEKERLHITMERKQTHLLLNKHNIK